MSSPRRWSWVSQLNSPRDHTAAEDIERKPQTRLEILQTWKNWKPPVTNMPKPSNTWRNWCLNKEQKIQSRSARSTQLSQHSRLPLPQPTSGRPGDSCHWKRDHAVHNLFQNTRCVCAVWINVNLLHGVWYLTRDGRLPFILGAGFSLPPSLWHESSRHCDPCWVLAHMQGKKRANARDY